MLYLVPNAIHAKRRVVVQLAHCFYNVLVGNKHIPRCRHLAQIVINICRHAQLDMNQNSFFVRNAEIGFTWNDGMKSHEIEAKFFRRTNILSVKLFFRQAAVIAMIVRSCSANKAANKHGSAVDTNLFPSVRYSEGKYGIKDGIRCIFSYGLGGLAAALILIPSALCLLETSKATNSYSAGFASVLSTFPQYIKFIEAVTLPSEGILNSGTGFSYFVYSSTAAFLT